MTWHRLTSYKNIQAERLHHEHCPASARHFKLPVHVARPSSDIPCGVRRCGSQGHRTMRQQVVVKAAMTSQVSRHPASAAASEALTHGSEPMVSVKFRLKYHTLFGDSIRIVGSHPKIGNWGLTDAPEMKWSAGDVWAFDVLLPSPSIVEYKYVVVAHGTTNAQAWQAGSNAVLALEAGEVEVEVHDNWGNNPGAKVISQEESMTREKKLQKWANDMKSAKLDVLRLQNEVHTLSSAHQQLKSEMARTKMELGMMEASKQDSEIAVRRLRQENQELMSHLHMAHSSLKNAMLEASRLLSDDEAAGQDSFMQQWNAESQADDPNAQTSWLWQSPESLSMYGDSANGNDPWVQGQSAQEEASHHGSAADAEWANAYSWTPKLEDYSDTPDFWPTAAPSTGSDYWPTNIPGDGPAGSQSGSSDYWQSSSAAESDVLQYVR